MKTLIFAFIIMLFSPLLYAQDANALVEKVKAKLSLVNDYQATGVMKTDVSFMKVPESNVDIYYKKPDKFRIKKSAGISVTPKGGVSVNLNSLLAGEKYTAIAAGTGKFGDKDVTLIKLLPLDEKTEIVVSTLYIDEKELLIRKAVVTTKSSGTYEIEMQYGKYSNWGLPDRIALIFSTQDYKLPKGLAFDYDTGEKNKKSGAAGSHKGKVELVYNSYTINKGVNDALFQ